MILRLAVVKTLVWHARGCLCIGVVWASGCAHAKARVELYALACAAPVQAFSNVD
jgi:hypothetical protein